MTIERTTRERAERTEQAERERALALASGALAVHRLREALRRYGGHAVTCSIETPTPQDEPPLACACGLDAALKADGGGDVRDWLGLLWQAGFVAGVRAEKLAEDVPVERIHALREEAVDEALRSPPALPPAEAALVGLVAWVRDECALSAADGGEVDVEHGITIPLPENENAADNVRFMDPADLVRRLLEGGR